MAPFSFSVSVSYGSSGSSFQQNDQSQDNDSRIPPTIVMGGVLTLFLAQVGVNLFNGLWVRRIRRNIEERHGLNRVEREGSSEEERSEGEGVVTRGSDEG